MKSRLIALTLALGAGLVLVAAAEQADPRALFEAARKAEVVDGDLEVAIQGYERVASTPGADRALAAQALVRMADCYRTLGNEQARAVYERILRDYADQKDAVAIAQARLGGSTPAEPVRGDRAVWSGPDVDGFGTVSQDGRLLTFVDWDTGRLMLRDLLNGTSHPLTTGGYEDGQADYSAISRDGRFVAYEYMDGPARDDSRYRLLVARLAGTSLAEPRVLIDNESVTSAAPRDWSPDGQWLAVDLSRPERKRELALVSVRDGAIRSLRPTGWMGGPKKIVFSPDGRFIAFDLVSEDSGLGRDVFVTTIDGSRETAAVTHSGEDVVMGWSPDGTSLLFASDRGGAIGLWAVPIADGRPAGAPLLVKSVIGQSESLGMTRSGTLYVWKGSGATYAQVMPIDLERGTASALPDPIRYFQSAKGPSWSADGSLLAYTSCSDLDGGPCRIVIRSAQGEAREVSPPLWFIFWLRWAPDARSFAASALDRQGRPGIFRIDSSSGAAAPIGEPGADIFPSCVEWSPDGAQIYYHRRDAARLIMRTVDVATGEDRELLSVAAAHPSDMALSPDGGTFAFLSTDDVDPATSRSRLMLVPSGGGVPKAIFEGRLYAGVVPGTIRWTPDGRGILVVKRVGEGDEQKELWLVPTDGRSARKLDIDVRDWTITGGGFGLSPDGRRIAFVGEAGRHGTEIWALENVVPEPAGGPGASR